MARVLLELRDIKKSYENGSAKKLKFCMASILKSVRVSLSQL